MRAPSNESASLWAQYFGAFVLYVGLGLWLKTVVLNWIVGPLFPLIVLYLIPRALRLRPATA